MKITISFCESIRKRNRPFKKVRKLWLSCTEKSWNKIKLFHFEICMKFKIPKIFVILTTLTLITIFTDLMENKLSQADQTIPYELVYFGKNNLRELKWGHAVNSMIELEEELNNSTTHMIEVE